MLDLRLPIGYFFLINAGLLIGDGLANPHQVTLSGQMFNLDIVWGAVMGVFGLSMAGFAWRAKLKAKKSAAETAGEKS
ncbi:MAG TPA: hypothetical protein V6D22_04950 [Candidatus Obscuribacterales bacterium]